MLVILATGSQGGGAPPVASSAQAAAALGLAPLGTVPVAIFPPYATPRTLPAISVIFAENPAGVTAASRRLELSEKVSHFASLPGNNQLQSKLDIYIFNHITKHTLFCSIYLTTNDFN